MAKQPLEQGGELVQRDHVGPVAGGGVGIGMGLEEQAVDAQGHGGPGQRLDHGPIAAGGGPQAARLLDAVRGVEDHRHAEGLHLRDRPHVVDQPAVAEERPPFAQQDVAAAGGLELADHVLHVPGGQELPLLHVDRPARGRRRHQQIGLPGEKGGDLQQVAHLGRPGPPAPASGCRWSPAGRSSPSPRRRTPGRAASPGPRYESTLVRLALSNDALKTSGSDSSSAICRNRSAIASVAAASSITHGPAMTNSGWPRPQR